MREKQTERQTNRQTYREGENEHERDRDGEFTLNNGFCRQPSDNI